LRPGRFDRIINIPLPDTSSRRSILDVHLLNKTYDTNIDVDNLAVETAGFSGAELKNLVNEAAINAVRVGQTMITSEHIEDALQKLTVGIIKDNDTRSDDAILRVSLHEIGHAFLAASFEKYFELKKVSIQSTYNGAGGFTSFSPRTDIVDGGLYTKDLLMKRLIVCLGGKAAESVFYGDDFVSLGAQQDLKQANSIAKKMIGKYGMGTKLKTFFNENDGGGYSDYIKDLFDKEVQTLLDEAYDYAYNDIYQNQHTVNILANILTHSITMDGDFVSEYVRLKQNDDTK
jgi:cell division protease FtsH